MQPKASDFLVKRAIQTSLQKLRRCVSFRLAQFEKFGYLLTEGRPKEGKIAEIQKIFFVFEIWPFENGVSAW